MAERIVIRPQGFYTFAFANPLTRDDGDLVDITLDVNEVGKQLWALETSTPIVEGDPDTYLVRVEAYRTWAADFVPDDGKAMPALTDDQLWSFRHQVVKLIYEIKKKVVPAEAPTAPGDGSAFTESSP